MMTIRARYTATIFSLTRRVGIIIFGIWWGGLAGILPAQQSAPVVDDDVARAPRQITELPRGFRGISFGMSLDAIKDALVDDPWFQYRGDPDVSMLIRPRSSLVVSDGSLFIARGLFELAEDALSVIVLELRPETIDWFTLYTTLESRYGTPVDMNPDRVWWEDGSTRLALERPLTVKYLDLDVLGAAEEQAEDRQHWRADARENFLDEL